MMSQSSSSLFAKTFSPKVASVLADSIEVMTGIEIYIHVNDSHIELLIQTLSRSKTVRELTI